MWGTALFKVALSFPNEKYLINNVLRNYQTYIIINGSYEGICVEFEQINKITLNIYFQIAPKY